jgi:Tol biopolymer transport system component
MYSVNDLPIFYHSARKEIRDTADRDSYLAYYLADTQTIKTCPQLARKERLENWPAWSPDGRYLYYCVAPKLWSDGESDYPPKRYGELRYGLERIRYDVDRDRWGEAEPVLSPDDTGKSVAMPRVSPDGRWLSFCMFDHGFFPNWHEESDLYVVDLDAAERSGKYEYRKLEVSSDRSESWHSWSLNSRWLVFSSKRDHGIFTRLYFAYVDDTGRAHKPFVLPQKDPAFYDSCLLGYNTGEFLTGPIPSEREDLERVIRDADGINVDAVSMPTPKAAGSAAGDRE